MDYLNALCEATVRIREVGVEDHVEAQAALRLACAAFECPAVPDRWSALLGLELLSVLAELYPDPAPVVITVTPSCVTGPETRAAVGRLLLALAGGYEQTSVRARLATGRRFVYAAAASRLRAVGRELA